MKIPQTNRLLTDESSFKELQVSGGLYVDKTMFIQKLLERGTKTYLLTRPRRFGKSLFLNTLETFFQGKRELFSGLAIEKAMADGMIIRNKKMDWKPHPIIKISFMLHQQVTAEQFEQSLSNSLDEMGKEYGVELSGLFPVNKLEQLIKGIYVQQGPVVVLIDEYDNALLHATHSPIIFDGIKKILNPFFSVTKDHNDKLAFTLFTGIARANQVSIFSGMNHVTNISDDPEFSAICGYTQEEVDANFSDFIFWRAQQRGMTVEGYKDELKFWYNGYRFTPRVPYERVYCPYTLAKHFTTGGLPVAWWYNTATPSFMLPYFRDFYAETPNVITDQEIAGTDLQASFGESGTGIQSMLYHTGYLTIISAQTDEGLTRESDRQVVLGYPNEEVRSSLPELIIHAFSGHLYEQIKKIRRQIIAAISAGEPEELMFSLREYLIETPYNVQPTNESHLHSIVAVIADFCGLNKQLEVRSRRGSMDLVVHAPTFEYVIEFKFNATAQEALQQIKERAYHEQFVKEGKRVFLVGVNYKKNKTESRMDWVIEEETRTRREMVEQQ